MNRLPLRDLHAAQGARFGPFAGFEMPLHYRDGLRVEHLHTRAAAGLFDVSHMGQIRVHGPRLHAALEGALALDFEGWPDGEQRYSMLANERGGIEDDLMVTRLGAEVRIVVNASQTTKDLGLLRALCPELSFELLEDGLLALQGPAAERVLATLEPGTSRLKFMRAMNCSLGLVSRCGYTGEDGFEISVSRDKLESLARRLIADPAVKLVGLGARDTLRLEAGLHLYGQDMDSTTTIVEAALGWAVARSRRAGGTKPGGFCGAEVYLREAASGTARKLVGLVGEEPVPVRHGAVLVDASEREVGHVTSGTVSPSTEKAVMLAYLATSHAADAPLYAVVRGKRRSVQRASLPFVPKRYKRS